MGINGLLPLLKSIQKPCNLKKFAGQTIGVDAYGWLHRGTVACAIELGLGKPTRKHIDYSIHRVRMLLHFGVIPYIVFDGDYLPSKAKTEAERGKRREESKQKGLELYRLNKPSQAHLELQKAVDVNPEMARQFIDELKKLNVAYVVAPYEADAQMVYLEKKGLIQGILSEDSDLLVFGAKRLLTKLDQYGDCVELNRADFTSCKEISLVGWTDAEFRRMAILSGCDYLASLKGMGLKTAYRLVRKHKTIEKIVRVLRFDGQFHVPPEYLDDFYRAELTFLHQRVFCPTAQEVVMITEPEKQLESKDLSFIGEQVEKQTAIGVAKGDLDPMTKAPIYVQNSQTSTPPMTPWTNARKGVIADGLSNMKGNQSIESFFKSKRTPLAELDVNIFTPSPSQARILRQNEGANWTAVSAGAQGSSLEAASPMPRGLPTPLSEHGTNLTRLTNVSTAKKRRLLINEETLMSSDDVRETSSKFFTATTPQSHGPHGRTKSRKKATDFTVWSDDSVENAMIELAADTGAPTLQADPTTEKSTEAEVPDHIESKEEPCLTSNTQEDTQTTHSSDVSTLSATQISMTTKSSTGSMQSFTSMSEDNAKASHVEQSTADTINTQKFSEDLSKVKSTTEIGSNLPPYLPQTALTKQKSVSALQRLGMGALGRSKSYTALSTTTLPRVNSFDTLLQSSSKRKTDEPPQRLPHLPLAYTFGPDASMAKGSEDALIPSSEGDGSVAFSEEEEEGPPKPMINLGRFAFSG